MQATQLITASRCLWCGGEALEPLVDGVRDRLGYVEGSWAFLRCRACGSALLSPRPRDEDIGALYPPVYTFSLDVEAGAAMRALAKIEYSLLFGPSYRTQVDIIMRAFGRAKAGGARLLDVGCGRGYRIPVLQANGFTVEATDFEPAVVDFVARKFGIRAVATDVDGLSQNFEPESFDVLTAFYVLEHVPDVHAALRAYHGLLKPGGVLVAAVPLVDGLQPRLLGRRWSNIAEAPRHLSVPSSRGFRKAAEEVGFAAVEFYPDSALQSAANIALSVLPGGNATSAYGGKLAALGLRGLGAGLTLLALPVSMAHRRLGSTHSFGLVAARKG